MSKSPLTHWIGDGMSPRTDLNYVERKIASLVRLGFRPTAVHPVTIRYNDCAIQARNMPGI
jgi:hypothetical protein